MKILMPYKSLNHTLQALQRQVRDSLLNPNIKDYLPEEDSPRLLYRQLKDSVTYVDDPEDVEHIKTVQSLFDEFNGRGDCDDFTVYTLASCYYNHLWPCQIILFGDQKSYPTHIASSLYRPEKGKYEPMDLTAPWYNYLRSYKYYQFLDFYI